MASKEARNTCLTAVTRVEFVAPLVYRPLHFKCIKAFHIGLDFSTAYLIHLIYFVRKHLPILAPNLLVLRAHDNPDLHFDALELFSNGSLPRIRELFLAHVWSRGQRLCPDNVKLYGGSYSSTRETNLGRPLRWPRYNDIGSPDPLLSIQQLFKDGPVPISQRTRTRPSSEESALECSTFYSFKTLFELPGTHGCFWQDVVFHIVREFHLRDPERLKAILDYIKQVDGPNFDVDHQAEPTGETALSVALRMSLTNRGGDFFWQLLLRYGADPLSVSYSTGLTPFMIAIYIGMSEDVLDDLLASAIAIHGQAAFSRIAHSTFASAFDKSTMHSRLIFCVQMFFMAPLLCITQW
jgi:hypothetical protein